MMKHMDEINKDQLKKEAEETSKEEQKMREECKDELEALHSKRQRVNS